MVRFVVTFPNMNYGVIAEGDYSNREQDGEQDTGQDTGQDEFLRIGNVSLNDFLAFCKQPKANMRQPFNDGEHIIYVNGADKDSSTELGRLMHDFFCTNPDDMYFKQLADKVRYFKEDEKGVTAMCKAMEDMRNEAVERDRIKNAIKMLEDGLDVEKVAEYSGLPIEKVRDLAGSKGA